MKIIWISNIIFPEICNQIKEKPSVSGGWMQSGAHALLSLFPEVHLAVASLYNGDVIKKIIHGAIVHYLLPKGKNDSTYDTKKNEYYSKIYKDFCPDLIHIHGTEYPHSLSAIRASGDLPTVISIQGLVHTYEDHYFFGGIYRNEIKRFSTLRDIFRHDTIIDQQNRFLKRGLFEIQSIKECDYVIGRTRWDRTCTWAIDNNVKYFVCNETLRKSFYENEWDHSKCIPHSIFLSQSNNPLKGIHQVFKALPLILRDFPDTQIFIAGRNLFEKPWYLQNGYALYLKSLMKKLKIQDKVTFTGILNEEQMAERFAISNAFISASSIENSPNSVGEAQLIGTPVIASYVGGTMDMVQDEFSGLLYRFDEIPMLAECVCRLFRSKDLCQNLSNNAKTIARERHNLNKNSSRLFEIYRTILSC